MIELFINNMSLILGFILGILSTTFGNFVQYFLDKNRLRNERIFQFNREKYFNLQNKAQEILSEIYKYDDYFNKCVASIVQKEKPLESFVDKRLTEHYKIKEVVGSYIILYFPDVNNEYKKFSCLLDKLLGCFMDVLIDKKPVEQKHRDIVNEYKKDYGDLRDNLISALKNELINYSKEVY